MVKRLDSLPIEGSLKDGELQGWYDWAKEAFEVRGLQLVAGPSCSGLGKKYPALPDYPYEMFYNGEPYQEGTPIPFRPVSTKEEVYRVLEDSVKKIADQADLRGANFLLIRALSLETTASVTPNELNYSLRVRVLFCKALLPISPDEEGLR